MCALALAIGRTVRGFISSLFLFIIAGPACGRMGDVVRIELSCQDCGQNRFDFPAGGNDQSEVVCAHCGHVIGTMAELKDAVATSVTHKTGTAKVRRGPRGMKDGR